MSYTIPAPHPLPEVDIIRPYITDVVRSLELSGVKVDRSWLDPMGPLDATIVFGSRALVWNEWTGWTIGAFISGQQGTRTILGNPTNLLDTIEPLPDVVADAVVNVIYLALIPNTDDTSTFIDA